VTLPLLGQREITWRSYAAGSYGVDGKWDDGAVTNTTIVASVQEASARDLQQLDAAERAMDPIKAYVVASVETTNQHTSTQAARLVIDGHVYKVRQVGPRHPLIPHVKVLAIRLQEAG